MTAGGLSLPGGTRHTAGVAPVSSRRVSHREYARWRSRQIAYGRWQPWADAGPVRDHVHALRRQGASYHAVARAAGVSPMTVHHLVNGSGHRQGQLPCRIGSVQAERLLAVTVPVGATGWRDACGARRRARALVALGHCPAALARGAGVTAPRMTRLLAGRTRHVSRDFHAAVCGLYEEMWNQVPPERTRREQVIAEGARRRAGTAGWPPPMGLDDDRIDDPAYRPRIGWRRAAGQAPAGQIPAAGLCTRNSGGLVIHRPESSAGMIGRVSASLPVTGCREVRPDEQS